MNVTSDDDDDDDDDADEGVMLAAMAVKAINSRSRKFVSIFNIHFQF